MLQTTISDLTDDITVYKVFDEYQTTKQIIEMQFLYMMW